MREEWTAVINRNYLPYKSAREYVDRGMAKWMGFFISEHSAALSKKDDFIDVSEQMNREEILFLIGQAYLNQSEIFLYTSLRDDPYYGKVFEVRNQIFFESEGRMLSLSFEDIIKICGGECCEFE